MKSLKSHFVFNRSERNGIFLLVLIIIILQAVYFFIDFSPEEIVSPEQQEKIAKFQRQLDSLKRTAVVQDTVEIYPFNPNFISDFKGYTLGMSVEEIDRLHQFRAEGKWVNSKEDFQEVTGVSDSLLKQISPYFKFPEWVENPTRKKEAVAQSDAVSLPIEDLNEATAEALMRVDGVGEVLSKRIVKYRESIGGFVDEVQLYDVYGLSPEVVERITQSFQLLKAPEVVKQDLNSISVLALSEIPGFTYELAREVVDYRNKRKGYKSFEELANINGITGEKIERIQLYLTIK